MVGKLTVKEPKAYNGLNALFLEQRGQLVPYLLESFSVKDSTVYIKFEGIDTAEQAMELRYAKLYLPPTWLPKPPEDDPSLTIGYTLHDEKYGALAPHPGSDDGRSHRKTLIVAHEKTGCAHSLRARNGNGYRPQNPHGAHQLPRGTH